MECRNPIQSKDYSGHADCVDYVYLLLTLDLSAAITFISYCGEEMYKDCTIRELCNISTKLWL